MEYAALLASGLLLATVVGAAFTLAAVTFAVSGAIFNVLPVRFKELPYLDVVVESANNPVSRLTDPHYILL